MRQRRLPKNTCALRLPQSPSPRAALCSPPVLAGPALAKGTPSMRRTGNVIRSLCSVAFAFAFVGCAATPNDPDPFESVNRRIYWFNEALDKTIVEPAARGYRFVLPSFVRTGVSNFFSNLGDIRVSLNNALQGKTEDALSDFSRVVINSTIGMAGLLDVASEAGIERHQEDFGQTLGRWGVGPGPFVMLPFFGPSTVRDTLGWGVDIASDPVTYVDPSRSRNQLSGTRLINRRSELLDASKILDQAALDEYLFVRDAYLQRRRSLIYDGAPPPELDTNDALNDQPKIDAPKKENRRPEVKK
jgi:phospholipid-binding lipoprotein MlaA